MKITNVYNLPQPLVDAIVNDSYTKGDAAFSVTELLQPPKIAALSALHWDSLEEDASSRIWSLLGRAVHHMIDQAAADNAEHLTENIFYTEILGHKVKGQADDVNVSSGILSDYKVTTSWKLQKRDFADWTAQQNIYSYMLREHGITVNKAQVIAILRDWSKPEAARTPNYPQHQVTVVPIELWPHEAVETFLIERINLHLAARAGILPECSDEERWVKPTSYAVMKEGNSKASKIYDTVEEAEADLKIRGAKFFIQHRPGATTRCELYCPVSKHCEQWANDPRNRQKVSEDLFGN